MGPFLTLRVPFRYTRVPFQHITQPGQSVRTTRTRCPPLALTRPDTLSALSGQSVRPAPCLPPVGAVGAVGAVRWPLPPLPLLPLEPCYTVATRRYGIATRLLHCVSIWFLVFAGYEGVGGGNPGSKSDSDLNQADSRWPDPERPDLGRSRSLPWLPASQPWVGTGAGWALLPPAGHGLGRVGKVASCSLYRVDDCPL